MKGYTLVLGALVALPVLAAQGVAAKSTKAPHSAGSKHMPKKPPSKSGDADTPSAAYPASPTNMPSAESGGKAPK